MKKLIASSKKIIADLYTPVGIFLKIRENYGQIVLLESSDYSSKENSMSFICFDSLSYLQYAEGEMWINDKKSTQTNIVDAMGAFMDSFEIEQDEISERYNGIFGFNSFDAVQQYESIRFDADKAERTIPDIRYDFYKYIIAFDHYHNEIFLIENREEGEESQLDRIEGLVRRQDHSTFEFCMEGDESSTTTEGEYIDMVRKAKEHCHRGDVFQLVLSRRFQQGFKGDEFNVYRALRSINPSPYLFYFDYGNFKIFGSSPEAQLKVTDGVAEIHPIAGTFLRTGNTLEDKIKADELLLDPKENAEHVMLVDLARNDLSKSAKNVKVRTFRDIQYYSHVIHLVSIVEGQIDNRQNTYQLYADTFPAGTLSGAPKYKAMELINKYEKHGRSFYGGGIGFIHFNGNINKAIIIRSFLSKDGALHYQAGAGLVIDSDENKELKEVNNKLAALKKALLLAENI